MKFATLVEVYEKLEAISSGNEMREILAEFFTTIPKEDIGLVAYLTLGKVGSEYESVVLGLAEKSIVKAIAKTGGVSEKKVKELLHSKGDAGLVAQEILKTKPQTLIPVGELTIHEFFDALHKVAGAGGSGSAETKANILVSILQKTDSIGAKYLIRIVLGQLRMGVGDMTVLDALSIAYTGEKKNKDILERAYNICPDVGEIATTLAQKGLKGIEKIEVQVGRPIKMMLAQRIEHLEDLSKKMPGTVSVEGKYDGERIQIHKMASGKVRLFSRRLDTVTSQFPDLVTHIANHVSAKEVVLEGEILAIDEHGNPLPFQTLMKRRRKYDIEKFAKEIPIQLKAFDVLYVDGTSYIHEPYEERAKVLAKIISEGDGVMIADKILTEKVAAIEEFFEKMLEAGYEGIMIKNLQGEYQAGTRGWNWIKWKKEYVKDLSDTFDLVVVGAYTGRGRRSGMYGALLCAAYNAFTDQFETVCKLGTGFTDVVLEKMPDMFKNVVSEKKPVRVVCEKAMQPDVWFIPENVVEVGAAEITKSPSHAVGLALRFPRFLHFRDDKDAQQATTTEEIKEMYENN